jgi:hypothetical protein
LSITGLQEFFSGSVLTTPIRNAVRLANVRRHATFRDCGNPRMRICVGETERRKMTQCEK